MIFLFKVAVEQIVAGRLGAADKREAVKQRRARSRIETDVDANLAACRRGERQLHPRPVGIFVHDRVLSFDRRHGRAVTHRDICHQAGGGLFVIGEGIFLARDDGDRRIDKRLLSAAVSRQLQRARAVLTLSLRAYCFRCVGPLGIPEFSRSEVLRAVESAVLRKQIGLAHLCLQCRRSQGRQRDQRQQQYQ